MRERERERENNSNILQRMHNLTLLDSTRLDSRLSYIKQSTCMGFLLRNENKNNNNKTASRSIKTLIECALSFAYMTLAAELLIVAIAIQSLDACIKMCINIFEVAVEVSRAQTKKT